uniref:HDC14129 n=1 Tax=Drosophila melanogaster TaxID=7227 RepID=Q6IJV3_DROME|nr:TPA_inf: HDC14129 [Drosophila melanogaster]
MYHFVIPIRYTFSTFCAELGTGLVASHEADVACESGKPGNQQVAPFLVFYI